MATVNAASLTGMVDDSNITDAEAEAIIDHAIDVLNMYLYKYDITLNNLSGTSGSKTLTVESRYKGAIIQAAVAVYMYSYKTGGASSSSASIGDLSYSTSASTGFSSGQMKTAIMSIADELKDQELQSETV